MMMRRVAESALRILTAVVLIAVPGFACFAMALRQPSFTTIPFDARAHASAKLLREHVRYLTADVRPRSAARPENLERAAAYIAARFRVAGGRTSLQTFCARGKQYENVVAEFGPPDHKPVFVVGAHYDSFGDTGDFPAADDNASGTAGLLELARILGASEVRSPVIIVAYTNEEPPFFGSDEMGSAVHARALAAEGRRVEGMISLEMIGYFSKAQNWPNSLFRLIYPSRGDFIGVAGGWQDRHLARHVKRAIAGVPGIPVVSFSGPRETSDASDQRSYWAYGTPAVMVTDTAFLRNPNYHMQTDDADTLNYEMMKRVVDGVASAVLALGAR